MIVTSLDRRHCFSEECLALVVSPQGCGLRASQTLPLETPVLLSDLPHGGKASGRVASCLPLGTDGKQFLIGVVLYNPGNVWGIAEPPDDWNAPSAAAGAAASGAAGKAQTQSKNAWPYDRFTDQGESHPGRK